MAGVEMLYSQEFLRAARARLNPGGIYAQWFHGYETDRETISIILRTYASVFDDVAIWYTLGPDLLLIGFTEGSTDPLPRLRASASSPSYQAGLARAGIEGMAALLAHEIVPRGILHRQEDDGQVHTLLHPILSDRAARAFFAGQHVELPSFAHLRAARIGERNSLLRRWVRDTGGALSADDRARLADQLCRSRPDECAVVLARWLNDEPGSAEVARRLREIQTRFGVQGPPLSPPFVRQLSRLFEAGTSGLPRPTPQSAARQAQLFSRYYFAGVPFHRPYLAGLFDRCATDQDNAARCLEERRKAAQQLGALEAKIGS
jgi:hypothetical protein